MRNSIIYTYTYRVIRCSKNKNRPFWITFVAYLRLKARSCLANENMPIKSESRFIGKSFNSINFMTRQNTVQFAAYNMIELLARRGLVLGRKILTYNSRISQY